MRVMRGIEAAAEKPDPLARKSHRRANVQAAEARPGTGWCHSGRIGIGGGHPVGATGARMLFDAAKQVTGQAGEVQVEGARRFATLNIGGSCATVTSFVVGVDDAR